jgi:hypothetical protein
MALTENWQRSEWRLVAVWMIANLRLCFANAGDGLMET